MQDHDFEDLWVEGIAQQANDASHDEEDHVQRKYNDGDPVQPLSIVWEVVQQDRHDARAHRHGKPSGSLKVSVSI